MSSIDIQGIKKHYRRGNERIAALDGVDLHIAAGETVAIVGPSGSGKSTLLAILGCLDVADSGSYRIAGRDLTLYNEDELAGLRNATIGFVFQQFHLLPDCTVLENVLMPLEYRASPIVDADKQRASELLAQVGLPGFETRLPRELSGGQMQRVAIARALINSPPILLADEPTGNLDPETAHGIFDLLLALHGPERILIVVTHDESVAKRLHRQIRLERGLVVTPVLATPVTEACYV